MNQIKTIYRPQSLDDAYHQWQSASRATLLAGGAFLRLGGPRYDCLIDLGSLDLDYIHLGEKTIEIGPMTSLRTLESSLLLKEYWGQFFAQSLGRIVGVQLRNIATIGGTLGGRYGFSDLITALLAIDARVSIYPQKEMTLENYLETDRKTPQLIEKIILPIQPQKASFSQLRLSEKDFAIINLAVSARQDHYRIAVGARPGVARLAKQAMDYINGEHLTSQRSQQAGQLAAKELTFSNNALASADYRRNLCASLVARTLMEVANDS